MRRLLKTPAGTDVMLVFFRSLHKEQNIENNIIKKITFTHLDLLRPIVVVDDSHRTLQNLRYPEYVVSTSKYNTTAHHIGIRIHLQRHAEVAVECQRHCSLFWVNTNQPPETASDCKLPITESHHLFFGPCHRQGALPSAKKKKKKKKIRQAVVIHAGNSSKLTQVVPWQNVDYQVPHANLLVPPTALNLIS